eukprot:742613-Hanusia_phi.AAC.1
MKRNMLVCYTETLCIEGMGVGKELRDGGSSRAREIVPEWGREKSNAARAGEQVLTLYRSIPPHRCSGLMLASDTQPVPFSHIRISRNIQSFAFHPLLLHWHCSCEAGLDGAKAGPLTNDVSLLAISSSSLNLAIL